MNNEYFENDDHRYEDMLDLPHHVSQVHPPMSRADRAAQFSPFAALTGFGETIRETGRITQERVELGEDARNLLDEKLGMLQEQIGSRPRVTLTYFQQDEKSGIRHRGEGFIVNVKENRGANKGTEAQRRAEAHKDAEAQRHNDATALRTRAYHKKR